MRVPGFKPVATLLLSMETIIELDINRIEFLLQLNCLEASLYIIEIIIQSYITAVVRVMFLNF